MEAIGQLLFRSRAVAWLAVVLWALSIVVASSISAANMPTPPLITWDKALHAIVFAIFAGLVLNALSLADTGMRRGAAAVAALSIAIGFGISDEIHQMFTPGRSPSILDVVADGVGAAFGVFVVARLRRCRWRSDL